MDQSPADVGSTVALSRRPPLWLALAFDVALAVAMGAAAFWFGERVSGFAVGFPRSSPLAALVVVAQVLLIAAFQGMERRLPFDWLLRVAQGVVAGTALGAAAILALFGRHLLSPVLLVDGVLVAGAVVGWRTLWMLAARLEKRAHNRGTPSDLIDRSEELTTVRGVVMSLYGYRELLKNLVWKDVKLKYRGSVFGFLWSLANPLLMIVVYSVAFTFIIRVRATEFVFHLMLGQLAWTFFSSSAAMSTGAIIDNSGLLKSVIFPRAILPISTVLFNLVQFLLTLGIFLPVMMLWYRMTPGAPMLAFPVVLFLQVVFTMGVALILATATAFFRDVRHLLEVALAVLFWTTPIVYELAQVPQRYQPLALLSPVSSYVVAYQQICVHQGWPDVTVWAVMVAYAFGAFGVGALLFLTFEDRFTEQL